MISILPLLSSDSTYEKEIYTSILESIFPKKETIYVWTDLNKNSSLYQIKKITIVTNKNKADILMLKRGTTSSSVIKFALSYGIFNTYTDDMIGGFYWQKGRPNLIFIKDNLAKYNITLPRSMQKFIEDDL